MQELIDKVEHAISYNVEGGLVEKYTWTELFNDMEKALEKEKEQIIQPVDRLCDFYGHPHIGEQMYNTRYTTPILKPINK